jgi:hypothetical protein
MFVADGFSHSSMLADLDVTKLAKCITLNSSQGPVGIEGVSV